MTTKTLRYRLLNVFTANGDRLSGNPLCVFEDGSGLTDTEMQALARQFNLSETTFILPRTKDDATARVRIFTPTFEMPFAGHPTLGTAHVVRSVQNTTTTTTTTGDRVVLAMKAGLVEVVASGDRWTLRTAHGPETRTPSSSTGEIAAMLSLAASSIAGDPLWVDTGAEQLIIPLASADDVRRAKPSATLIAQHGFSQKRGASMAYVWAPLTPGDKSEILARFFFNAHDSIIEDPATGSACANLGGYLLATRGGALGAHVRMNALPIAMRVHQGEAVGRPSHLHLSVDSAEQIFVAGDVIELASGTLTL